MANQTISPNEQMPHGEGYFVAGQDAVDVIKWIIRGKSDIRSILDMPCGHGRVLRYLNEAFPEAAITACDVLKDGVDFCASELGALPIYANDDPLLTPLHTYDLIWVGSLFTHFDSGMWTRLLMSLRDALNPKGILVFTTHGYDAYRRMFLNEFGYGITDQQRFRMLENYCRTGFAFEEYKPGEYYGVSLSSHSWVANKVASVGGLQTLGFSEAAWVGFHDVYACTVRAGWHEPTPI